MQDFIQQQNLLRYRDLLLRVLDPEQRRQIEYLIKEEEAKIPPKKVPGETG
ncbi:MAG: hypothetical protein KIT48_12775 [Pseudolabrys sp.]|nr:hypothetical protein [Pseudolabrys sp.]